MPLCSNRLLLSAFLLMGTLQAAAVPQTPAAGAQSSPTQAEKQLPLNVDRDPVAAPEEPAAGPSSAGGATTIGRDNGKFTLQRSVDEVVLNATVVDDKQHLITTLTKDDFKVAEDGVAQVISSFQHQDIPISLGILVDNSGSMRTKRQAVNSSALDLVRASNPDDESFIVNFSDEAYIDQDFTANVTKLRDGLSHIDSKGGTALYDAIMASADYLTKNAKRSKQVLLVITDGEDNASSTTLEETVRRIQDLQGPVVYSIGLLFDDSSGGRETRRAKRALDLLANETGGMSFFPKNLNQVDDIAGQVAHDIREQYTIGYHSTKPVSQGGFRMVHVEAKAKGYNKLIVRTRTGYYPNMKKGTTPPAGTSN
jgi:Ca-activated chloride channel family protein